MFVRRPSIDYMTKLQTDITQSMRGILIDWLVERPFTCSVDDCQSSYRRKDHLTRHLLQHQGKLYECPFDSCKQRFTFQGNIKRHINEFHDDLSSNLVKTSKQYVCPEIGCGKVFKYASKLRKHENSHVKLDAMEAFCYEPGCMKLFTNEQCLKEHFHFNHQYIECSQATVKCTFDGCLHSFSNKSNLNHHVKAVHLEMKG